MKERTSFFVKLACATGVVGALVTGLVWLGRERGQAPHSPSTPSGGAARGAASSPAVPSARALAPADAWLVVDFDGALAEAAPFPEALGATCTSEAFPERLVVSVLPSREGPQKIDLVLAAPRASLGFFRCVEAQVLSSGGRRLEAGPERRALETPSGVVLYEREQLLFSSDRAGLSLLLGLAAALVPNAATAGPHPALVRGLPAASSPASPAALVATLELPRDWLADVGPDAARSPLRHLIGGALEASRTGRVFGTLVCIEPGCADLFAFVERARSDLPPDVGASLRVAYEPGQPGGFGRVSLEYTSTQGSLPDLARRLWQAF